MTETISKEIQEHKRLEEHRHSYNKSSLNSKKSVIKKLTQKKKTGSQRERSTPEDNVYIIQRLQQGFE